MTSKQPVQARVAGFSLVELMVVVAMIMVLISLLVPSLKSARDSAVQASCANKLRVMGVGLQHYIAEQMTYPRCDWMVGNGGNQVDNVTWAEALYPHMFNRPVPAFPRMAGTEFSCPARSLKRLNNNRIPLSYQINDNVAPKQTSWANPPQALRLTDVPVPAGTLIVADDRQTIYSYLENNDIRMANAIFVDPPPHRMKNNFLFCDGHVRLMDVRDTVGKPVILNPPKGMWTPTPGD